MADNVIKIYVEDGLEASLHSIGTEVYVMILCNSDLSTRLIFSYLQTPVTFT